MADSIYSTVSSETYLVKVCQASKQPLQRVDNPQVVRCFHTPNGQDNKLTSAPPSYPPPPLVAYEPVEIACSPQNKISRCPGDTSCAALHFYWELKLSYTSD